jgi:hypothetical protein
MMNDTNNRVSANRRETMIIKLYFKHEKSGTKLYAGDASHRRILVVDYGKPFDDWLSGDYNRKCLYVDHNSPRELRVPRSLNIKYPFM